MQNDLEITLPKIIVNSFLTPRPLSQTTKEITQIENHFNIVTDKKCSNWNFYVSIKKSRIKIHYLEF